MTVKGLSNFADKEKQLLFRIEKTKQALVKLQEKRTLKIGLLVIKHGLDRFDDHQLESIFQRIQAGAIE